MEYALLSIGIIIRALLIGRLDSIKYHSMFNTPLSDSRSVFESFSHHDIKGTYFANPNAINQPLMLIKMLHFVHESIGLDVLFVVVDGIIMVI